MVMIFCDKCKKPINDTKVMYRVETEAKTIDATDAAGVYVDDAPFEKHVHALCGRCMTQFVEHQERFFEPFA